MEVDGGFRERDTRRACRSVEIPWSGDGPWKELARRREIGGS